MTTSTVSTAGERAQSLRQRLHTLRAEQDEKEEAIAGAENALARAKIDGQDERPLQSRLHQLESDRRTTSAAIELCERELEEAEELEREGALTVARQQVAESREAYAQAISAEHAALQRLAAELAPLRRRSERAYQAAVKARGRAYRAGATEFSDAHDVLTFQQTPDWARGHSGEVLGALLRDIMRWATPTAPEER